MTDTMTAWAQDVYGGPDVVQSREVPVPTPGAGEVRIDIAATALNSADVRIMRGEPLIVRAAFGLTRPKTPVPGRDVAGRVAALGPDVTGFRVGDRVVGELPGGGLAASVVARAASLVAIPDGVSDETAAALPLAGGTAWQALEKAAVDHGDRVLVLGAGGGVGLYAVRLAALRGAHVHALTRPDAMDAAAAQGAAETGDRDQDLATWSPDAWDAIIVLGGDAPLPVLQRLLREGGTLVSVSGGTGRVLGPLGRMLHGAIRSNRTRRIRALAATAKPEITERLLQLAADGQLRPHISATWPRSRAGAALRAMDAGGVTGKLVVTAD